MLSLNLLSAKSVPVYDCDQILHKIKDLNENKEDLSLKKLYEKLIQKGSSRYLVSPYSANHIKELKTNHPNFVDVIDDIVGEIVTCQKTGKNFKLYPILLAGDPGVGKTYFSKQIAHALNSPFFYQNMSTLTAGWVLSGSSTTWSGAKCGKVATSLINEDYANPLILLDELDKTGGDSRYDPFGVLLELFEGETAKQFKDEYLDVSMDSSHINWVCTANDIEKIPDYIQSRMSVYHISRLDKLEQVEQTKKIFNILLEELNLKSGFEQLSDEVIEICLSLSTRELKKEIYNAISRALSDDRVRLGTKDFRVSVCNKKKSIGFN